MNFVYLLITCNAITLYGSNFSIPYVFFRLYQSGYSLKYIKDSYSYFTLNLFAIQTGTDRLWINNEGKTFQVWKHPFTFSG